MPQHKRAKPHLSRVVAGTLLDSEWACPEESFLPAGNPTGMEDDGCRDRPGWGASLNEESGNQNGGFKQG